MTSWVSGSSWIAVDHNFISASSFSTFRVTHINGEATILSNIGSNRLEYPKKSPDSRHCKEDGSDERHCNTSTGLYVEVMRRIPNRFEGIPTFAFRKDLIPFRASAVISSDSRDGRDTSWCPPNHDTERCFSFGKLRFGSLNSVKQLKVKHSRSTNASKMSSMLALSLVIITFTEGNRDFRVGKFSLKFFNHPRRIRDVMKRILTQVDEWALRWILKDTQFLLNSEQEANSLLECRTDFS